MFWTLAIVSHFFGVSLPGGEYSHFWPALRNMRRQIYGIAACILDGWPRENLRTGHLANYS